MYISGGVFDPQNLLQHAIPGAPGMAGGLILLYGRDQYTAWSKTWLGKEMGLEAIEKVDAFIKKVRPRRPKVNRIIMNARQRKEENQQLAPVIDIGAYR